MTVQAQTEVSSPSLPRVMLHAEGFVIFMTSIILYGTLVQGRWWLFAALLLLPDVAIIPYIINKRVGMIVYNIAHTYALPLLLLVLSILFSWLLGLEVALIWIAHIGMDRTVGYGLKYIDNFKTTHMNRI